MSKATHVVVDGVSYPLDDTTAVDFSEAQSLSTAEKQQARTNIGAGSAADVTSIQTAIGTVPSGSNLQGEVDELKSQLDEAIEEFAAPTQEAVDNWLTDHPEATTTVQDGSLTYKKLVPGTLGYVTPEMYGAKGDGVTDDTQAFNDAFASGHDVTCNNSKTYYLEGTVYIQNKCVFDGKNALFKLKPYSSRHQVFRIEADGCTVRNLQAKSEFTGTYNGTTPSDCNQFVFVAASDVLVENIKTDTVFSAVWLNDGDVAIKNNIVIRNITSINGQFNIFARYANNLTIDGCYLTVDTIHADFHQIYIASHVNNLMMTNNTVLGTGTASVSLHPSSSFPETPDIENVTIDNLVIRGVFTNALEFRSCKNLLASNVQIISESTKTVQFLIRHEACENCKIQESYFNAINGFVFSPNPNASSYQTAHTSDLTLENCVINIAANTSVTLITRFGVGKIIGCTIKITGTVNNPYVFATVAWDNFVVLNVIVYGIQKSIHMFNVSAGTLKLINCSTYTGATRLNYGVYTGGNCYVYDCKGYGFTHCVSGADDFNAITGAANNVISTTVINL